MLDEVCVECWAIYIYIYIYTCTHIYIYIYIYMLLACKNEGDRTLDP